MEALILIPKDGICRIWDCQNSDFGNAAFFLAHFADQIKYVPDLECWRIWDGERYITDNKSAKVSVACGHLAVHQAEQAELYANELQAERNELRAQLPAGFDPTNPPPGMEALVARILSDSQIAKLVAGAKMRAQKLGDVPVIAKLLKSASESPDVIAPLSEWDNNPLIIKVQNGIIDFSSGKAVIRKATPEDLVSLEMAVKYDAQAVCQLWKSFIEEVQPNEDQRRYLQRIMGYSMTGRTDDQAFYFMYGTGKNGKSIFVRAMQFVFGSYASHARANLIEEQRNGSDCKHDLALLPGIRFLFGDETSNNSRMREGIIKALAAGDPLTGEHKYQTPFTFNPVAKLFIIGNHKPGVDGTDEGIWRRVRLVSWTHKVEDHLEIASSILLDQFKGEGSGILNWLIAGLAEVPHGGIPMPEEVRSAVAEYRADEDGLGEFIKDYTVVIAGSRERKVIVFAHYVAWAKSVGLRFPLSQKQLTRQLKTRGWVTDGSQKQWQDIYLPETTDF